jgi:hypothetical protein
MSFVKYLTSISVALLIAGCGGGSDDPQINVPPTPTDQSPVGLWEGTLTIAGVAGTRGVLAAIASDGEFTATIAPTSGQSDGRILRGTGTVTSRNQFAGSGTVYSAVAFPAGGLTAPVSISGTVITGTSIAGSYAAGGETGTLALTYRSLTNRPSSQSIANGVYTALAGNTQPGTVVINNGVLDWSSTACIGFGSLSTIDTTKNIYRWSMEVSQNAGGCTIASGTPLQGLAWLAPHTTSGLADQVLVLHGTRLNAAYVFIGQK